MDPLAPTVTGKGACSKNTLPSVLVVDGPLKPMDTYTGWCGTSASSSASVGSRRSAK
jgi:hypothetical protein